MMRTLFATLAVVAAPVSAASIGPFDGLDRVLPDTVINPYDVSPGVFSQGLLEGTGLSIGALPNPDMDYIVTLAGTALLPYEGGANGQLVGNVGPELDRAQRYILSTTFSQIDDPIWHLSYNARGLAIEAAPPVPEAHEWAMIAAGLGLVGWVARKRRAQPIE